MGRPKKQPSAFDVGRLSAHAKQNLVPSAAAGGANITEQQKSTPGHNPHIDDARTINSRIIGSHSGGVSEVTVSHDGLMIASGGNNDSSACVWQLATGTRLHSFESDSSSVSGIAFLPSGKGVAFAAGGNIRIHRLTDGESIRRIKTADKRVTRVAFSPNGNQLTFGCSDGTVGLCDFQKKQVVKLAGHDSCVVYDVTFSPDSRYVLSAGEDKQVNVWDSDSHQLLQTFSEHKNELRRVRVSPDGTTVASGGKGYDAMLWRFQDGKVLQRLDEVDNTWALAFGCNGALLATGGGTFDKLIRLWRVLDGKLLHATTDGNADLMTSLCFTPDGRALVSGSGQQDPKVRVWDLDVKMSQQTSVTRNDEAPLLHSQNNLAENKRPPGRAAERKSPGEEIRPDDIVASARDDVILEGQQGFVKSAVFSPDGSMIAAAGGGGDFNVYLWKTLNGPPVVLEGHSSQVQSVAFSPDNRKIISASFDRTIRIWDVARERMISRLDGHDDQINAVAFSPNGSYFVTGSLNEPIHLWDAKLRSPIRMLGRRSVCCLTWSPDGNRVYASTGQYHEFWLQTCDVDTGEVLHLNKDNLGNVACIAVSPKRAYCLSAYSGGQMSTNFGSKSQFTYEGGIIIVWDTAEMSNVHRFAAHDKGVRCVSFSSDGGRFLTGGDDGVMRLWETGSWKELDSFSIGSGPVMSVAFSRYDTHALAGGGVNDNSPPGTPNLHLRVVH